MDRDRSLRDHLLNLLAGKGAHLPFPAAVEGWPENLRGVRPPGAAHSAWMLVEHMRIAQWDILEYVRNPGHVSPTWPEGYWPPGETPPTAEAWEQSVAAFAADLASVQSLVDDPATDLLRPMAHTPGHTVLREVLLVADHNAYHLGQLVVLRRLLGAWHEPRRA